MKEMLDILKERLPDGLEIVKVKNKNSSSQIEIHFNYEGTSAVNWLPKVCAPGHAEQVCDRTSFGAMLSVALHRKDLEMAERWVAKMQSIGEVEGKEE